jgi:hypothetical protein
LLSPFIFLGGKIGYLPAAILSGGQDMGNMDSWDVTLLVVAGYLAVVTLVRLMARRRNQLYDEFHKQAEEELAQKKILEALKKKRERAAS